MRLGAGAYKVGGARQWASTRKEVSMATLWGDPTGYRYAELEGWEKQHKNGKQAVQQGYSNTLWRTKSKKARGHQTDLSIIEKNAAQHCRFEVNFA